MDAREVHHEDAGDAATRRDAFVGDDAFVGSDAFVGDDAGIADAGDDAQAEVIDAGWSTDAGESVDAALAPDAGPRLDPGTCGSTRCDHAVDCQIVRRSCCDFCGAATADSVRAVTRDTEFAPCFETACRGAFCPLCPMYSFSTQRFFATCEANVCRTNVLTTDTLACAAADDCRVLVSSCMTCDAPLIAVNASAVDHVRSSLCSGGFIPPPCAIPSTTRAECISGLCTLTSAATMTMPSP